MVFRRRGQQATPTAAPDTPQGYTELEVIDRGGFAVVYRARDERFDRTVALKVLDLDGLDERSLRRFRAECMATGRVSAHPNIVTVYDAGTTPSHKPWLAMEYCSGGSLARRLESGGPMPVATVLDYGVKLAGALQAAHSAGILHRDLKPQNVLLTAYGEAALADFGIALMTTETDAMAHAEAFTVVHSAPEILEGHEGTVASDLYSLASTLWTLLAGRAPYAAEASVGLAPLVTRILRGDVPALPRTELPPGLDDVLRQTMSAQPAHRPGSAAELGGMLADIAGRLPGGPCRAPSAPLLARPPRVDDVPHAAGDAGPTGEAARRAEQVAEALQARGVVDPETTHAVGGSAPGATSEPRRSGLPAPGTRPTSLTGPAPRPAGAGDTTHRRADLPELDDLVRQSHQGAAPSRPGAAGPPGGRRSGVVLLAVFGVIAVVGIAGGVVWGLTSGNPAPEPKPTSSQDATTLAAEEAAARAPRDVVVTGLDGGRLQVSWTLPDPTVIPYVRIEPRPAEPLDLRQGMESITVTGLESGTTYCATVIGLTIEGENIGAGQGAEAQQCGTPR